MTVLLSEEEQEFQHALRRFLTDSVTSEYRRKRIETDEPFDKSFSEGVCELGLYEYFSEPVSKERAGHCRELVIAAFESGRALVPQCVPEILLAGPCLISELMVAGESIPFSEDEIDRIKAGELQVCAAIASPSSVVISDGTIKGEVGIVPAGCDSLLLFVPGQTSQAFVVETGGGIPTDSESSLDLTIKRCKLNFEGTVAKELSATSAERLLSLFILSLCAQLAGVSDMVKGMTVEYASVRKQFDVPIGGFQAVQHGVADMHAHSEALRAVTFFASWSAEESKSQLPLATRSAALYAIKKVPWIVEKAIQLHGGIGFTWEHDLHFYLRRARLFAWMLELAIAASPVHEATATQ